MVDLVPAGSLSLRDFYEQFARWKWLDNEPFDDLDFEARIAPLPGERILHHRAARGHVIDAMLREAVGYFKLGRIGAYVLLPGEPERRRISNRAWSDAFFPERMFLATTIEAGHADEFDAAVGRTPFTEQNWVGDLFREEAYRRADSSATSHLRDCVVGLAMDGVLTDGDAERFATKWGLGPFERRPHPEEYDPRTQPVWSLAMVVSWIVWREDETVREAMDDYRANWWDWFGYFARLPIDGGKEWYEVDGIELKTLDPLSLSGLMMHEALDRSSRPESLIVTVKAAREDLWNRLAVGGLVATGIGNAGAVVQIPAHEWPYIRIETDDRLGDRLVFKRGGPRPAYEEVTFRQSDVLAIWPPLSKKVLLNTFDHSASLWSLLEAAMWVGCRGKELTSQEIADGDLEEKGGYELFIVLTAAHVTASGINSNRIREPIPAAYWEMATLDPGQASSRHYVSFIDDVLKEEGGEFTPYGERQPRWFGIKLERRELLAAFPQFAQTAGTPRETPSVVPRSSARKLEATKEAIGVVFPHGFPRGMGDKDRLNQVNQWLGRERGVTVSLATLARAAKSL